MASSDCVGWNWSSVCRKRLCVGLTGRKSGKILHTPFTLTFNNDAGGGESNHPLQCGEERALYVEQWAEASAEAAPRKMEVSKVRFIPFPCTSLHSQSNCVVHSRLTWDLYLPPEPRLTESFQLDASRGHPPHCCTSRYEQGGVHHACAPSSPHTISVLVSQHNPGCVARIYFLPCSRRNVVLVGARKWSRLA